MKQKPDKNRVGAFLSDENSSFHLILYNDNFNHINFVVKSLIDVCKHSRIQAYQCAIIAHLKGKSVVKKGKYAKLKSMKDGLVRKGINSSIE